MPPLPGADHSTIAASHTSGSRRSHGRAGLTAAACRKVRSYRSQQSPGTSRASLATMAMYVAKGTAHWGAKCTATAIKVVKDKVQSAMVVTGKRFFLPSSFRSSVEHSKARSRASGRRSPKSINFPSLILATNGPGMPKSPEMGSTRVGVSLAVGRGGGVGCRHGLCGRCSQLLWHSRGQGASPNPQELDLWGTCRDRAGAGAPCLGGACTGGHQPCGDHGANPRQCAG